MSLQDKIKQNREKQKYFIQMKKEQGVEPWRATGRTTRAIFDLCSRYPHGEFLFLTHNQPMAKLAFDQFVQMQADWGAPIKVNRNQMLVELHSARYWFKPDSKQTQEFINYRKCDLHPDFEFTVIEDHFVAEERHNKDRERMYRREEAKRREEARKASQFWPLSFNMKDKK